MLEVGPRDVVGDEERIVDLQQEAGVDDRLVFLAHRLGDREHIILRARVVFVRRRGLDVRRRDGRHEGFRRRHLRERRLERVEIGLELRLALVFDRAGTDHQRAAAPRADLLGDRRTGNIRENRRLARVGERARPRCPRASPGRPGATRRR